MACPGSFLQEQAEWNAVLDGEMKAKGKRTVLVMGTRVMHVSLPCLACMKQAAFKRLGADSETSDVNLLATKVGHAWWNACCARAELNKLVLFSGTFGELGDGLEVCMHILSPRQTMSDSFQVGCGPRIPYEFLARSEDKQVGTGNFQVGLSKQRPCRNFSSCPTSPCTAPQEEISLA